MPVLVLENVPQEVYDDLQQAAAARQRSLTEEALERLQPKPSRRQHPEEPAPTEAISAPCTIPLPGPGKPVRAKRVDPRLPDPPWFIAE